MTENIVATTTCPGCVKAAPPVDLSGIGILEASSLLVPVAPLFAVLPRSRSPTESKFPELPRKWSRIDQKTAVAWLGMDSFCPQRLEAEY